MRAVVFAYHEVGYGCLEELLDSGVEVVSLFTHEDDPHEEIWFHRPSEIAAKRSIPIFTPENLKEPRWFPLIVQMRPDVIFSFYYRSMIPSEILSVPSIGAFNLHGSLLPRFRGRCPVNWVLIEGETQTGVTLHVMTEKPDAGDIVAQRSIPIAFEDTAKTLMMKLAEEARLLVREVLPRIAERSFARVPQDTLGASSYFGGRRPEDGIISWDSDAVAIYNLIRAVTHPYPGAFTFLDGKKFFVWQSYPLNEQPDALPGSVVSINPLIVGTGKGSLKLLKVQLEGEDEMDGHLFAATHQLENKVLGGKH